MEAGTSASASARGAWDVQLAAAHIQDALDGIERPHPRRGARRAHLAHLLLRVPVRLVLVLVLAAGTTAGASEASPPPPPETLCADELELLCSASSTEIFECGACVGRNAAALDVAGCSEAEEKAFCGGVSPPPPPPSPHIHAHGGRPRGNGVDEKVTIERAIRDTLVLVAILLGIAGVALVLVVLLSCVLACLKRHNEQAFYMNDGAFYYPRGSSYQGVNVNVKSPARHPANRDRVYRTDGTELSYT